MHEPEHGLFCEARRSGNRTSGICSSRKRSERDKFLLPLPSSDTQVRGVGAPGPDTDCVFAPEVGHTSRVQTKAIHSDAFPPLESALLPRFVNHFSNLESEQEPQGTLSSGGHTDTVGSFLKSQLQGRAAFVAGRSATPQVLRLVSQYFH